MDAVKCDSTCRECGKSLPDWGVSGHSLMRGGLLWNAADAARRMRTDRKTCSVRCRKAKSRQAAKG